MLHGLTAVDLGVGMAPALVTKVLMECGVRVRRAEPMGGDPFTAVYPAYGRWRAGSEPLNDEPIEAALETADICILGGESWPGLSRRFDPATLAKTHPRLVVLDITAYPRGYAGEGRPGADILIQAQSGLAFEHYSDRPNLHTFQPSAYGAALHGLTGLLAALYARETDGHGDVVRTSLLQGALTWMAGLWGRASAPGATFDRAVPKDPLPLVAECADGIWLHIVMGTPGARYRLLGILGADTTGVNESDPGLPTPDGNPRTFFGDVDLVRSLARKFQSDALLQQIRGAGIAADRVLPPGRSWDDPQVRHNRVIRTDADGGRAVGDPIVKTPTRAERAASAPLARLRAVDLGIYVAGPYTTALLGDLGVETVKVEATAGDPMRFGTYRSFASANRGKRGLAVDMKTPEGREIVQRLCAASDVVTSNFRPGVAPRLGVDAASLHALRPDLIVLDSAGYGADGPSAGLAGFDLVFQALCGHEHRAGGDGNPPLWNRTAFIDYTGGLLGAVGVLQALLARARSGGGAALSVPLVNAGVFLMSELTQAPDGSFAGAPKLDAGQMGFHPAERLYAAADGWLAVCARDGGSTRRLAESLGLESAAAKPRESWGAAEADAIAQALASLDLGAAQALLAAAEVWAEPCRRDAQSALLDDPTLRACGAFFASADPVYGEVVQMGPLFTCDRLKVSPRGAAPTKGQDTAAVLAELGYGAAEVDALFARGVVA